MHQYFCKNKDIIKYNCKLNGLSDNKSSATLQYLNKTFFGMKNSEILSNTKINPSANILKYKKYIKPLFSWKKLQKRMASPINISSSSKQSKSTKANIFIELIFSLN